QSAIQQAKKGFFDKKIQDMCREKKPWEAVNWTRERKMPPYTSIAKDGNVIASLEDLWPTLHDQFSSQATTPIDWDFVDNLPEHPTRKWQPISPKEVSDALRNTANNSTPGPDNLSWQHWKRSLTPDKLDNITALFRSILNTGFWPSKFKESTTVVIPKPKKKDY
ncbi:hypothetical protein M378DRAFT_52084, partial [Amanita muscaria Koide BX008]